MNHESCVYCHPTDEIVLWQNPLCRAIFIADSPFPGWCRVVWHEHIAELSDLRDDQRNSIMAVVAQVEAQLRQLLTPAKINIASLGTALPHLHWHIVPRYLDDSHFPEPVWSQALRAPTAKTLPDNFIELMRERLALTLGE
jgi:diadenosine tetraphosphate (Ap4A) HIT family hydrolase